jgi:hypothetical protein
MLFDQISMFFIFQACKLLISVPHVPTLCCQIFGDKCADHIWGRWGRMNTNKMKAPKVHNAKMNSHTNYKKFLQFPAANFEAYLLRMHNIHIFYISLIYESQELIISSSNFYSLNFPKLFAFLLLPWSIFLAPNKFFHFDNFFLICHITKFLFFKFLMLFHAIFYL